MTASIPGLAPANDAELARTFHDRIRKLETSNTLRVGPWVISNDAETGALRATRPGHTVLIDDDGATELTGGEAVSVDLTGYVTGSELAEAIDGVGINLPTPQSVFAALYEKLTGILNPVNALTSLANFFRMELGGLINAARLPLIPLSHIRDVNPNLLTDGSFDDELSLEGFPDWDYDEADGKGRPGCAYTIADGNTHIIHSNPIEVDAGDKLNVEVYTRWLSLTALTGSIQLGISSYTVDNVMIGGAPAIVASTTGAGTIVGWGTKLSVTDWSPPATADYIVVELIVTSGATAGVVKFDDASARKTGAFPQSFVSGLVGALTTAANNLQNMLNSIWTSVTRTILDGPKTISDMFDALRNINPLNVIGVGAATIADTIGNMLDGFWSGLMRLTGGGKSVADVTNAATNISGQADTALQVGEWNNAVLGIRNNQGFDSGMDPTAVSMFELPGPTLTAGSEPPFVSVTSAAVPISFWLSKDDANRGSVTWYGKGVANITAFYIDVYRVNFDTAELEYMHTSVDMVPQLAAGWKAIRYNMVTADRQAVAHGDVLAFGFRLQGTGTHQVVGKWAGWMPADTGQVPQRPSATRTGVGTVALSALTYSGDIPWVAVGIVDGDIAPPYFAPRTTTFDSAGTYVYNVPTWAKYVDCIIISGGGGGAGGNPFVSGYGEKGYKGTWAGETLVRGVDFPDVPDAAITFTVGVGGPGGPWGGSGANGGASSRQAISGGKAAMSVPIGPRGVNNFIGFDQGPAHGEDAGNFEWNGVNYIGGTGGNVYGSGNGGRGTSPGAGGGGGSGGTYGVAWNGGSGGSGCAWAVARMDGGGA